LRFYEAGFGCIAILRRPRCGSGSSLRIENDASDSDVGKWVPLVAFKPHIIRVYLDADVPQAGLKGE